MYQTGELQARSWSVRGISGSQQPSQPARTLAGSAQSMPAALQASVLQRQRGFSTARA